MVLHSCWFRLLVTLLAAIVFLRLLSFIRLGGILILSSFILQHANDLVLLLL